jgi:hypothetical protein
MQITDPLSTQSLTVPQSGSQNSKNPASTEDAGGQTVRTNSQPDSVSLSENAQQLSQSTTQTSSSNAEPITNYSQAKSLTSKIVADIQNNPNLALNSHSNFSQVNLASLLG